MSIAEQLQRGSRALALPAKVALAGGEAAQCEEALRVFPRKRAVMRGRWRGRPALLKVFLDTPSGRRNVRRELAGYNALRTVGIATPELLRATRCRDGHHVLVFAFLAARRLGDLWRGESAQKLEVATAGLNLLARLHRNACGHTDPHLDNFLLADERIYVVDVGSIARRASAEYGRWQRHNLAFFLTQFPPPWRQQLTAALPAHYAQAAADSALPGAVAKAWRRRKSRYLQKCMRECGDFCARKTRRQVAVFNRAWRGDDLDGFLRDPDAYMAAGELLKDGNSATVVRARINGRAVVIKRNNIKNLRHGLRRCLRATRSRVNWRNAHLLGLCGIATPAPIAFVERRRGPLRLGGYYVCEWRDFPSASAKYQTATPTDVELKWFAELFAALRLARLVHGDLKASNLLVTDAGIALVDLDSMRDLSRRRYEFLAAKDRRRFLANWQDRPKLRELFAGVF